MTDYNTKIAKLESLARELESTIEAFGEDALAGWVRELSKTKKQIAELYSERFWGKDEYRKIKAAAK